MKPFHWNESKNLILKSERKVSFEDVVAAINDDRLLDTINHPNIKKYAHQKVYIVRIDDYSYLVPYVEDEEKIFLKTIIPSRKATKKYLKGEKL